jgi:NAD(P)H-flavin reductase
MYWTTKTTLAYLSHLALNLSSTWSAYSILFLLVLLSNALALGLVVHYLHPWDRVLFIWSRIPIFVSGNFFVGIAARNEHVINVLFRTILAIPTDWPLGIRRACAKVYHYGGVHSGCNTAATVWYLLFAVLVVMDSERSREGAFWTASLILLIVTLTLLVVLIIFATPRLRNVWHDGFEAVHRQGGWIILLLFWAQVFFAVKVVSDRLGQTYGEILVKAPTFWVHTATTALVLYPWLSVRKVKVTNQSLSDHVVRIRFSGIQAEAGTAVKVAKSVLNEYHAFAVIPDPNNDPGFSILVSNAGDWTNDLIKHPREYIWVRQLMAFGVVSVVKLFSPVVVVATGSGIGPCLAMFIQLPHHDFRVVWSTRSPLQTYGAEVLSIVQEADPNCTIINTDENGRPNLVQLTLEKFEQTRAEAIVIISRAETTNQMVKAMEKRNIPCFGPIFDS